MSNTTDDIPRRIRLDLMTPAELAIHNAMAAVENLPADPLLTEAVILLGQARDKVADFVDSTTPPDSPVPPLPPPPAGVRMGDRAVCRACGEEIEYVGTYWRHTGDRQPRHIAAPMKEVR